MDRDRVAALLQSSDHKHPGWQTARIILDEHDAVRDDRDQWRQLALDFERRVGKLTGQLQQANEDSFLLADWIVHHPGEGSHEVLAAHDKRQP